MLTSSHFVSAWDTFLKQMQNAKCHNKKQKINNKVHCQNVAHEIQTLLSEMHDHPFIQVIQTKGKPPSVILYLEDNLQSQAVLYSKQHQIQF
jgi:hypothetical protein